MTSPAILPYDRPLTADELRGFNMACACMITWGTQIARSGVALPPVEVQPVRLMADRGRFLVNVAEALHLTIGGGNRLPRLPALQTGH